MVAIEALGRRWLETLGTLNLWMLAAFVAVLLADRLLARRVSAGWRMAMYSVVFLRLFVAEGWSSPLALLPGETIVVSTGTGSLVAAEPVAEVARSSVPVSAPSWSWGTVVLAVHLLGAALLLVRLVRAHRRLAAVLRGSVAELPEFGAKTALHPTAGPLATGILRPRVVLTPAVLALSKRQRDAVVRHEQAHLRHRDPLLQLLLSVSCALSWPVLAVWLAASRLRVLMELRADECATQPLDRVQTRAYGRLLLDLASGGGWRAPALGLVHGQLPARLRALGRRRRASVVTQALAVGLAAAPSIVLIARRADDAPERTNSFVAADGSCLLDRPVLRPDGEVVDKADGFFQRAEAAFAAGDLETASENMQEAQWYAASAGWDHRAAVAAMRMVEITAAAGEYQDALGWARHAEAAFKRIGHRRAEIRFFHVVADLHATQGDVLAAAEAEAKAERIASLCE